MNGIKQIYDIMTCDDGVTRAVPVVDGVMVDPSLKEKAKRELEQKNAEKKICTKNQHPRSLARKSRRIYFNG